MEFAQELLTHAATIIEGIMLLGLPLYAIARHHIDEVKSWGTPQPTPRPEVSASAQSKAERRKPRLSKTGELPFFIPAYET
jgi:hypothetical protein